MGCLAPLTGVARMRGQNGLGKKASSTGLHIERTIKTGEDSVPRRDVEMHYEWPAACRNRHAAHEDRDDMM